MRITEISVTKLFGIFDHTIPLNLDDHITIIHSENGFGKTIILKMLHGLFNGRYSELLNTPFEKFQVNFDDNSVLWIEKEDTEPAQRQSDLFADEDIDRTEQGENKLFPEVIANFLEAGVSEPLRFSLDLYDPREFGNLVSLIDNEIPELGRAGARQWIYRPTGEILSLAIVLDRFYELLKRFFPGRDKLSEWRTRLKEPVEIHLIQTQRLQSIWDSDRESVRYRSGGRASVMPTVSKYAEELRRVIEQEFVNLASSSQSLDSTFPTRLAELMSDPNRPELTDDEIQARLDKLDEKRSGLAEIGILDKEDTGIKAVSPSSKEMIGKTKDLLTLYVQDMEEKLSVFDEIAEKIDLFKRMIDKRRFSHKKIVISREAGFTFVTQDGETLPLSALSSGEQHELVLLYQLLFKTRSNSLVLIDEPEISLHIAWQQEFLQDLHEITRLSPFDILIATHSPDIIHDRWDLTVRLEEPAVL